MREHVKPAARLFEHAEKEFDRMSTCFYLPSDSPVASCLVIAPKATKPFIQIWEITEE
jgi:hypothetical protein